MSGTAAALELPRAEELLRRDVDSGRLRGVQLHVRSGGAVADLALGLGPGTRPADPADTGRLYCAVKPVIAFAIAVARDRGLLDWDDPVSRFLPVRSTPEHEALTVRALLAHRSGLPLTYREAYVEPFESTVALGTTAEIPRFGWLARATYNNSAAWHVLAAIAQEVFGAGIDEVVREHVAAPLGLATLCLTRPADVDRFVPHYLYRGEHRFTVAPGPTQDDLFTRPNPAEGGFAPARELGLVLHEIAQAARGDSVLLSRRTAEDLLTPHGEVDYFGRPVQWGLGLQVDVPSWQFGAGWPRTAFAHAGGSQQRTLVLGVADPASDVVMVVRQYSTDARGNWRLTELGRRLLADLAG